MQVIDERVAFLEGRVKEHSQMVNGIRDALKSLEARMDRRFEQIDRRFEQFETRVDQRFVQVETRIDALDGKVSRQFAWLVGLLVTMLITVTAALFGLVTALLPR